MDNICLRTLKNIKRSLHSFKSEYKKEKIKNKTTLNEDKKLYIIRRIGNSGFFSNFFYVLGHLVYAEKKHYIPLIDMENYKTLYNEDVLCQGTNNAWEYYFNPKINISLSQAYNSKNIILSDNYYLSQYVPSYVGFKESDIKPNDIEKLHNIFFKHFEIKPEIIAARDSFVKQNFDSATIGIHLRGTDMFNCKGHPQPADLEKFLSALDEILAENNLAKIFLCTDETYYVDFLKERYGDKIITRDVYRAKGHAGNGIHLENKQNEREFHKYNLGLEVLLDSLILSKCQYLIYGNSNVPLSSIVFNNNKFTRTMHISRG